MWRVHIVRNYESMKVKNYKRKKITEKRLLMRVSENLTETSIVVKIREENKLYPHLSKGEEHKYTFPKITREYVEKRNQEDFLREIEKEFKFQFQLANRIIQKRNENLPGVTRINEKFIKKKVNVEKDIKNVNNSTVKMNVEMLFDRQYFMTTNKFETVILKHQENNRKWYIRKIIDVNQVYNVKILSVKIDMDLLNKHLPIEFVVLITYDITDVFGMYKNKIKYGTVTRVKGIVLKNENINIKLNEKRIQNRDIYIIYGVKTYIPYLDTKILQNHDYIHLVDTSIKFTSQVVVYNENYIYKNHGYSIHIK
jgi:hypothetical protein